MAPDVIEYNASGAAFEDKMAIYQYGDLEAGVFYSVSGNATLDPNFNMAGFNLTLPQNYYEFWNLSYVSVFNATPVEGKAFNIYYPNASLGNASYDLAIDLNGVGSDTQEVKLDIFNITNICLNFTDIQLGSGDSLRVYNTTGFASNIPLVEITTSQPYYNTSWLNSTSAYVILNSTGAGASYDLPLIGYQGVTYNKSGADAWNWTIVVDSEINGFNLTLSQLNLAENSKLFYSDPWGENITELWNVPGQSTNYTIVNENGIWGPSDWISPDYVVLALESPQPNLCNFTISSIRYQKPYGWQRLYYPEDTDVLALVPNYSPFSQYVNVSFANLAGGNKAATYPSWSFIFHKRPCINISIQYFDEDVHEFLEEPIQFHYGGNYTLVVNATDSITAIPIDQNNIENAGPNPVKLQIVQGKNLTYETSGSLLNGGVNFTLNRTQGLDANQIRGGQANFIVEIDGVNYGIYDNSTARTNSTFYFFEPTTIELNSISSEYMKTQYTNTVITTAGTIYDPNTVFFNVTVYNNLHQSEPLNGQPFNVTVWHEGTQIQTGYAFQYYHATDGANYCLYSYSFEEIGNYSVTFELINETLQKPQGYFESTTTLQTNITVIPRKLLLDIYNSSEGLHPGQVSQIFVNVTDLEEIGFPLVGWNVQLYFWRWISNHYEDYFIGTSTSNQTGIAQLNWLPPLELAGAGIFLQAVVTTPILEQLTYVGSSSIIQKGFDLERMDTNAILTTDRPTYHFNDQLTFSVDLLDQIGRSLVDEEVSVDITFINVTITNIEHYVLKIGWNNTGIKVSPNLERRFIGVANFTITYAGNAFFNGFISNFSRNFTITPTRTEISVDLGQFGFEFLSGTSVPVTIQAVDSRDGNVFGDIGTTSGSLYVDIYAYNGTTLLWSNDTSVHDTGISRKQFIGWEPSQSNLYVIYANYTGGTYYSASSANYTLFIDRAAINVTLDTQPIVAGQPLRLLARATYAKNGTVVKTGTHVLFEYTDILGNSYVLGNASTNASGYAELLFPYISNPSTQAEIDKQSIYLYMVEFGGRISVITERNLQYQSGSAVKEGFQIAKCPISLQIDLSASSVNVGTKVIITVSFATPSGISASGERLLVEVYSNTGAQTGQQDYFVPYTQFTYTPPAGGVYYIKVLYKGSHIFEANSEIVSFTCGQWQLNSDGEAESTSSTASAAAQVAGEGLFYIIVPAFLILVGLFALYKKKTSRVSKRKIQGLLAICLFAFAEVGQIVNNVCLLPNPYVEASNMKVQVMPGSGLSWLEEEALPADLRDAYINQIGLDKIADQLPSANNYSGMDAGAFAGLFGIDSISDTNKPIESPTPADGSQIQQLNLGTFGKMPYPIGDVINITFQTQSASNYYILINDIAYNHRVLNIFGSSGANALVEVLVPISEDKFTAGLDYALELYVYEQGSWDYRTRDMRRMVFSVVKGFTRVDVTAPDVEIFNQKIFTVTLLDDINGKPMTFEKVTIYAFDQEKGDFMFYTEGTTDANGQFKLWLPENSKQGAVPIKAVYAGNVARFGNYNSTSYTIKPLQTSISISASPVHYRDNGTLSALLYDEFGHKLSGKNLQFSINLENVSIGDNLDDLYYMENNLVSIGNGTTDNQGIVTLDYIARFPEGLYNLIVEFAGDDIYDASNATGYVIEVQKELLLTTFSENHLVFGEPGFITATLIDNEGEVAINTPVTFDAYYNHTWYTLGSVNTTGTGLAYINSTVYWPEGRYPLRLTKVEDNRYATSIEYGVLNVSRAMAGLDIAINSTEYHENVMLSAHLRFQNGSFIDPVIGETILFYVEAPIAGGQKEFLYIGSGITDIDGQAKVICHPDLPPGIYLVKCFFPGNGFISSIEAYEYGLQIRPALVKIAIDAAGQVPILDFADFVFTLSDRLNFTIPGEALHFSIYNRTNPTDCVVEGDIVTNGYGEARFRWVPGTLGNFTIETILSSNRYMAPAMTFYIEVIRKALVFNVTMNRVSFHRGENCSITGAALFAYKHQNGTAEYFPAPSVPLTFAIWNETAFIHPVSGFLVPNVPLLNLGGYDTTYTGSGAFDTGQFAWDFTMPDAVYGLQAGRYFLRIKVDSTKTGFYSGQSYISFDLVEYTRMNVSVIKSSRVADKQFAAPRLQAGDYYVDEWETIVIQLRDQDNTTLIPYNYATTTNRNLTINIGMENTVIFGVDADGTPYLYNDTQDFTNDLQHNPAFYDNNGTYRFQWAPFLSGPCDVGVLFAGDRFFEANETQFQRTVLRRPVVLDSSVSPATELYRTGVTLPLQSVQNFTIFNAMSTDLISGTQIPNKEIQFYYDSQLMTSIGGYGIDAMYTNTSGQVTIRWDIPNIAKLIQAGSHIIKFLASRTRNFSAEWSIPHSIEVWETTSVEVQILQISNEKVKFIVRVLDQDNEIVNNAEIAVQIAGYITSSDDSDCNPRPGVGGNNRFFSLAPTTGGIAEIEWNPSSKSMTSGPIFCSFDFIGDYLNYYRPSSLFYSSSLNLPGKPQGNTLDQWTLPVEIGPSPFSVVNTQTGVIYNSPHEIRQMLYDISGFKVYTYGGQGLKDLQEVTYVWQRMPTLDFQGYYFGALTAGMILCFTDLSQAVSYINEHSDLTPRIVGYDFVWGQQQIRSQFSPRISCKVTSRGFDIKPLQEAIASSPLLAAICSPNTASQFGDTVGKQKGLNEGYVFFEAVAAGCEELGIPKCWSLLFKALAAALNGGQVAHPWGYQQSMSWSHILNNATFAEGMLCGKIDGEINGEIEGGTFTGWIGSTEYYQEEINGHIEGKILGKFSKPTSPLPSNFTGRFNGTIVGTIPAQHSSYTQINSQAIQVIEKKYIPISFGDYMVYYLLDIILDGLVSSINTIYAKLGGSMKRDPFKSFPIVGGSKNPAGYNVVTKDTILLILLRLGYNFDNAPTLDLISNLVRDICAAIVFPVLLVAIEAVANGINVIKNTLSFLALNMIRVFLKVLPGFYYPAGTLWADIFDSGANMGKALKTMWEFGLTKYWKKNIVTDIAGVVVALIGGLIRWLLYRSGEKGTFRNIIENGISQVFEFIGWTFTLAHSDPQIKLAPGGSGKSGDSLSDISSNVQFRPRPEEAVTCAATTTFFNIIMDVLFDLIGSFVKSYLPDWLYFLIFTVIKTIVKLIGSLYFMWPDLSTLAFKIMLMFVVMELINLIVNSLISPLIQPLIFLVNNPGGQIASGFCFR